MGDGKRACWHAGSCYFPCVLEDKTADSMWTAIVRKHALPIETICRTGLWSRFQICTDSAAANMRLVKNASSVLPFNVLVMWCRCVQHQMALTIPAMIVYLNIVCPLFCACRILQDGKHLRDLWRAVRCVIEYELVFDGTKSLSMQIRSARRRLWRSCFGDGMLSVMISTVLARGLHEI